MKTQTQVVVIGGGVVGCSILYHLTKLGWSDVVLLERKELTAGSTWHAAGGFHTLNGDPNVARLQKYTIDLYHEIEKITGDSVGMHLTGGINLAATDGWWEMMKNEAARHKVMGIDSELISPSEIKERCPIVDVSDFKGGLYMADEGHIDPYSITHGYAKAAKMQGAEIYRHTKVDALKPVKDGSWEVITNQGTITAEHVVNAGGLWAREVGEMVGVELPLLPFEHHYLITDEIPSLKNRDEEIVTVVDLDGEIYLRQEQNGVLLGVYETPATPWSVDGTSWEYGETDLLPNDLERLYGALEKGFGRFPEVAEAGIKRVVNGPFTFSPDGNPLVGPIDGLSNYWVACGVMAGFAQGGGIGLTLAQWMIEGQPDGDVFALVVQGLEHGVGVDDGGGLGRAHEDDFIGGASKGDGVLPDTGHGVDDDVVEFVLQIVDAFQHAASARLGQVGHLRESGRARHEPHARWSGHQDVAHLLFALDHMLDVVQRSETEDDFNVGQAEVCVEQHGLAAELRERDG